MQWQWPSAPDVDARKPMSAHSSARCSRRYEMHRAESTSFIDSYVANLFEFLLALGKIATTHSLISRRVRIRISTTNDSLFIYIAAPLPIRGLAIQRNHGIRSLSPIRLEPSSTRGALYRPIRESSSVLRATITCSPRAMPTTLRVRC